MLTVINLSLDTVSDEFCTKNMYEFLQVIIKQLKIARTDIYWLFLNTMTRENKTIGILINRRLFNISLICIYVCLIRYI